MTYCMGIAVREGLVMASDSRTSAGVDHISTYSKMRRYGVPGQRQFVLCTAGNLSTSQGVFAQIERDMQNGARTSLNTVANIEEAASYVGAISRKQQKKNTGGGPMFESSFLLGGEVLGAAHEMMLVYPEGNHIGTSRQTPFLQIGEAKYGKPILDRVLAIDSPLDMAALCALVSMDSTMRSNLTVGPPIELNVHRAGSLEPGMHATFREDSAFLNTLKTHWDNAIKQAFLNLPPVDWSETATP